jgi:hypothetical protein
VIFEHNPCGDKQMSTTELTISSGDNTKEVGDALGIIPWWTCFLPNIAFVVLYDFQQFELS